MGNPVRPGLIDSPWQGKNPAPEFAGIAVPEIWADEIIKEFQKGMALQAQVAREIAVVRKEPYT